MVSGVMRVARVPFPFRGLLLAVALTGVAPAQDPPVDQLIRSATATRDYLRLEQSADAALGAPDLAQAESLLAAALRLREAAGGRGSVLYAEGLVKLADFENRRGGLTAAEAKYREAAEILRLGPAAARAWRALGVAAMSREDWTLAASSFERAEAAAPEAKIHATMWLALVREREERTSDAEALFQQAVARAGGDLTEAALVETVYARFLARQGRAADAAKVAEAAAATRRSHLVPQPEPAKTVFRIGGGVSAPRLLTRVEPQYSDEARAARLDGTVVLSLVVDADGRPRDLRILRPLGLGLDAKALDAIAQWRFAPGTRFGEPVPVQANVEINFRLL